MAQTAHAVFRAISDPHIVRPYRASMTAYREDELGHLLPTSQLPVCIVCYVKSEKALLGLYEKARGYIRTGLQVDAGHNEVDKGTVTSLCLGPVTSQSDLEFLNEITRNLQTLKD